MSRKLITTKLSRRDVLRMGATGAALGMGGLVIPPPPSAHTQVSGPESQVGKIYELQAAFHRAKTTQDIDLMMSLWDREGTLNNEGDPNSPYVGFDRLEAFWLGSGSFTHRRFSLVPSFKTQIEVRGHSAWLYFECHDVGDYDLDTRFIAGYTFLAGTVRRNGSHWVFWDMTAGSSYPLSVDDYYFP